MSAENGRAETIAAKVGTVTNWLNPELATHSHRARAKVRQWFKAQ
jgi:(p)ppGpp synthase/HD superfamily hydrolase